MEYEISDEVWNRVVQIIQEGMISLTDVTDGLRRVRVETSASDLGKLVLTSRYKEEYKKMQDALVEEGKTLYKKSRGEDTGASS